MMILTYIPEEMYEALEEGVAQFKEIERHIRAATYDQIHRATVGESSAENIHPRHVLIAPHAGRDFGATPASKTETKNIANIFNRTRDLIVDAWCREGYEPYVTQSPYFKQRLEGLFMLDDYTICIVRDRSGTPCPPYPKKTPLLHPNLVPETIDVATYYSDHHVEGQEKRIVTIAPLVPGQCFRDIMGAAQKDDMLITLDMMAGCNALHGCNVVHGDIKPANGMGVWEDGRQRGKLFDMESMGETHHDNFGTPQYSAAYYFREKTNNWNKFRFDVFSFGITTGEVIRGETPFYRTTQRERIIWADAIDKEIVKPFREKNIPQPMIDVVAAALDRDARTAPTLAEMINAIAPAFDYQLVEVNGKQIIVEK